MSQTNTNTNTEAGNTNWNENTKRSGQGHGGSGGKDRGGCRDDHRNMKEKRKMVVFSNSSLPKADVESLNTKRLLIRYPSYIQTRTTDISMISFVQGPNYWKVLSYRNIRTQDYGQARTI